MWATVPLAISIVGILGLVGLKRFELRRDRPFFANVRARLDMRVGGFFAHLRGNVPYTSKQLLSDIAHHLAVYSSAIALVIVRFVERRLTRFLNMVKGRRQLKNGNGTNSTYLRDVTNHRDEVRRVNGYHPKK